MSLKSVLLFILGSSLISIGSGVGMVQSYAGNLPIVAVSLITFLVGFRICQYSVSDKESFDIPVISSDALSLGRKTEIVLFTVGVLTISQGFIFLTGSVVAQALVDSFLGGLLIIGGYIPTHVTINETVI